MNTWICDLPELRRLRKKNIAVIGLGVSNMSVITFLRSCGCNVTALDKSDPSALKDKISRLDNMGVSYRLGDTYLDDILKYDEIFIAPGVPVHTPEIRDAVSAGVKLNGEIKLFLNLCRAKTVGITGSAGKTTTTSLVYEIVKRSGKRCILGGNIGFGVLEQLDTISPDDFVILELSSFQLQIVDSSPWISAILNLAPNHLDQHTSLAEYYGAKENIIRYQNIGDYSVLNFDDPIVRDLAGKYNGRDMLYSLDEVMPRGGYIEDGKLIYTDGRVKEQICAAGDIRLPGKHNISNTLAAAVIGRICEISAEDIRYAISQFQGVEHRLEYVKTIGGVAYYNDTIATSPDRTSAAINAFDNPLVLILGGYDKNLDYDDLGKLVSKRVKAVVLLGSSALKIRGSIEKALGQELEESNADHDLNQGIGLKAESPSVKTKCKEDKASIILQEIRQVNTLADAVEAAREMSSPGDSVLLSPACASFDMFSSYKERGKIFKDLVNNLVP